MKRIKFLVMDVDGTLTNGKIYMGQEGEIAKAFDVKDGCGISLILPKMGITPVIITARCSLALQKRCIELGIEELYQNVSNKLEVLYEIVGKYDEELSSVAYVGDDIPDMLCMLEIKKNDGLVLCPSDAIPEIKAIADFVAGSKAGEGAVRDCITYLSEKQITIDVCKKIDSVVSALITGQYEDKPEGFLPDGTPFTIQEYYTRDVEDCNIQTHRCHIEIQYLIEGLEKQFLYSAHSLISSGIYHEEDDCEIWEYGSLASVSIFTAGSIAIINPNQAHKDAVMFERPCKVKKIVCRIMV